MKFNSYGDIKNAYQKEILEAAPRDGVVHDHTRLRVLKGLGSGLGVDPCVDPLLDDDVAQVGDNDIGVFGKGHEGFPGYQSEI